MSAMKWLLVWFVAACAAPRVCPPNSPGAQRATLGDTFTLDSKILGERRVINVYVPPDYATSKDRYPVLYMPDGGMTEDFPHVAGSVDVSIKNAVIRPVIVGRIQNTESHGTIFPTAALHGIRRAFAP